MKNLFLFVVFSFCLFHFPTLFAATDQSLDDTIEAGFVAEEEGRFQDAIDLLLPIKEKIPSDSIQTISDVINTLAGCYGRIGDIDNALKYGKESIEFDEKTGIKENLSSSLNNMAFICIQAMRAEEAEEFLKRSIAIEKELGRNDKLAIRLGMLGETYTQMERPEEGLELIQQALELDRNDGREEKVAIRLSQLGNTLSNMRRFAEAEPYLQESVELLRKHNNLPSLAITLISLAFVQRPLFRVKEAESNLKECIRLSEQLGMKRQRMIAYIELSRLYKQSNDPQAYEYLNKYMLLKDSLTDEQIQQQISDLKVSYETQEKEHQIAIQQSTISRQRILYSGLGLLLVLAIVALILAYRSNKLKEQNMQLKDRFIQLISHDLKNPALAQQRNLHSLIKCYSMLEPEDMKEQLVTLTEAADSQMELLYDLLDWANLQTGRLQYTPIQMDLCSLAQKVVEQHSAQARLKNIKVTTESIGSNHLVKADRQMIATILRNVLSNAIKFTPKEGEINITIDNQSVIIKDNGIGFDTTNLVPQKGTFGEEGTSLGLNLAHKLARINHTKLEFFSTKGAGTTANLTF